MRFMNIEAPAAPVGLADVLAQFPGTIFPTEAWRIDFAELGYALIDEGARPTCDEDTHQVLDGPVALIDGVWTQSFEVAPLPADVVLARREAKQQRFIELRRQLVEQVDSTIAAIYSRWLRFEAEYVAREAAARAFVAGGYEGEPGVWIMSFAVPAGLPAPAAADRIIEQADGLRTALEQLAALRMAKYGVQAATGEAEALVAYEAIIGQANVIAGAL